MIRHDCDDVQLTTKTQAGRQHWKRGVLTNHIQDVSVVTTLNLNELGVWIVGLGREVFDSIKQCALTNILQTRKSLFFFFSKKKRDKNAISRYFSHRVGFCNCPHFELDPRRSFGTTPHLRRTDQSYRWSKEQTFSILQWCRNFACKALFRKLHSDFAFFRMLEGMRQACSAHWVVSVHREVKRSTRFYQSTKSFFNNESLEVFVKWREPKDSIEQ